MPSLLAGDGQLSQLAKQCLTTLQKVLLWTASTYEERWHAPVDGDGDEGEDAGGHRARRDELRELAVDAPERPVAVQHEDEVEHRVEDGDERVGDGQIHQEVIGHRAHALVSQHDPDDDEIPAGGDRHHGNERRNKRHLSSADSVISFPLILYHRSRQRQPCNLNGTKSPLSSAP